MFRPLEYRFRTSKLSYVEAEIAIKICLSLQFCSRDSQHGDLREHVQEFPRMSSKSGGISTLENFHTL